MKYGRQPRTFDKNIPKLDNLTFNLSLSTLPESVDYSVGMPSNLGMMLNDTLGDCTCAAYYHALQVWSFHTQKQILTEPDDKVLYLYEKACGYNPANGGEGPGGVEQNVLTYLHNYGAPMLNHSNHHLAAFFEIDVKNTNHLKSAIYDCGVLYIGFNVPAYLTPDNGKVPSVWDVNNYADNSIVGGHAVIIVGYNKTGLKVISWGQYYTMTWAFWNKFVDEAYALVDVEWINNKNKTPLGMTVDQLKAAMVSIKE